MKNISISLLLVAGLQLVSSQSIDVHKIKKTAFLYFENGKTGLVDADGNILAPVEYDRIEDLAANDWYNTKAYILTKNGTSGLVDYSGKLILPVEYSSLQCKNDSCIATKNGKTGYTDIAGKFFIPAEYDNLFYIYDRKIAATKDGKIGFLNLKNEWIIPPKFDAKTTFVREFSEGLAAICQETGEKKCGYINESGEMVIPQIYESFAKEFHNGFARIYYHGKEKFINRTGKMVFNLPENDAAETDFENGIAKISTNCRRFDDYGTCDYYLINTKGERILPKNVVVSSSFPKENYHIVRGPEGVGIVDNSGKFIIPANFTEASLEESVNLFEVKDRNKDFYELSGFYDRNGKKLTEIKYDVCGHYSDDLDPDGELFLCVERQNGEGRGVLNKFGKEILKPDYDNVELSDGVFMAYGGGARNIGDSDVNRRCGYFDISGKPIIPMKYISCTQFQDGVAVVSDFDGYKVLDKKGQILQDFGKKYSEVGAFHNGIAQADLDEKTGFINPKGEVVIPFRKYDYIYDYNDVIQIKIDGKYGVMDKKGKIIVPTIYQDASNKSCNGKVYGKNGEKYEWYDLNGKRLNDRIPLQQCYNYKED